MGLDSDQIRVEAEIPVTSPALTLIDIAPEVSRRKLEAAINSAMVRELVDPDDLTRAFEAHAGRRGVRLVRQVIERHSFVLTDSELERLFVPLALRAGLGRPLTRQTVNGYRVDFFWPDLGLVVETDGLRFHRDPVQQAIDRERDQAHTAAGLTPLRFTHYQVRYRPGYTEAILRRTARHHTALSPPSADFQSL